MTKEWSVDEEFEGLAEAQAGLYFRDLLGWVKDLHTAHLSISSAFSSLLGEFSQVFPRSRLQLYPRSRPLHGPTALYWGEIVSLRVRTRSLAGGAKKVIRHLAGPFQVRWAFTKAMRADLAHRLLDFDRRRLALNDASRSVLAALNHLRNATFRKFPADSIPITVPSGLDPGDRRIVPDLPEEFLPLGLPPRISQYLRSGWVAAFSLALAEQECEELGLEVSGNPSAEGLRLEISERKGAKFARQIRWIHTPANAAHPKLTKQLMRELHLREGVRPVLSLKERKRRRIAKSLAVSAGVFDSIRKKCEEAQLKVSRGLAEASVILLPGSNEKGTALPTAG